jgi:sorbitol-specific phosphotransferase system component IIBC
MQIVESIGRGAGRVVGTLYQSGREAIDQVLKNILPFMAFISFVIGLVLHPLPFTDPTADPVISIGNLLAQALTPLASNPISLIIMSLIIGLPVLSPLLGPGAVIAQVIGTLLGTQFASGALPPATALPALFAINPQVGCDFIPVGLALGEAEPETVEVGVPAVLFSRLITGPIAVIIAWVASVGL